MRLQNIIIAMLMFSLFAIVLVNSAEIFVTSYNSSDSILEDNESRLTEVIGDSFNRLNSTQQVVADTADKTPGGSENEAAGAAGAIDSVNVGLSFVSEIGRLLFTLPRALVSKVINFLGLPREFATVATIIIIAAVSFTLVASVLRNKI